MPNSLNALLTKPKLSIVGSSLVGGIRTQPEKIQAVYDWQPSTNVKELRSFLSLCGFYQRFVVGYAKIVAPLTDLIRKDIHWH